MSLVVEECPGPRLNLLVVKFSVIYLASLMVSLISRDSYCLLVCSLEFLGDC